MASAPSAENCHTGQKAQSCSGETHCIAQRFAIQWLVITGFRHKGLEAFYRAGITKGIQASHAAKLGRILGALDVAVGPEDLNFPSFRLHPLIRRIEGLLVNHSERQLASRISLCRRRC